MSNFDQEPYQNPYQNTTPNPYQNPYQTAPDSYQDPYQTAPDSYQDTTSYYSPMQQPLPPKKMSWYKRRGKTTKFGIGCLAIIGVMVLGGLYAVASTASKTTAQSTPPPAMATLAQYATSTPTNQATPVPTAMPTSTSTYRAVEQTPLPPPPRPFPPPPFPPPPPPPQSSQQPYPPPPPPPQLGVNGNPWGYDFAPGTVITDPPAAFCSYFACVNTFWKDTNGYVEECENGEYSHLGGISGACSRNGGELQPLYQHQPMQGGGG